MAKRNRKDTITKRKPTPRETDDALAAIIASTKRKKRKLDPLQVAEKLSIAREALGSTSKLCETVGLSREMVRQILSVRDCAAPVKQLIRQNKLTSFDILHRLSKLGENDQGVIAEAVVKGCLNSDDVRVLVGLRKSLPEARIADLIERVQRSRNIKHYVAYFVAPQERDAPSELRERVADALGKNNVVSISMNRGVGEIVMNREGKDRLQEQATRARKTKREYLQGLVEKG